MSNDGMKLILVAFAAILLASCATPERYEAKYMTGQIFEPDGGLSFN